MVSGAASPSLSGEVLAPLRATAQYFAAEIKHGKAAGSGIARLAIRRFGRERRRLRSNFVAESPRSAAQTKVKLVSLASAMRALCDFERAPVISFALVIDGIFSPEMLATGRCWRRTHR